MKRLCRRCGAWIIEAVTERGTHMPIDPEPHPDGAIQLLYQGDTVLAVIRIRDRPTDVPLHRNHFATCPNIAPALAKPKRKRVRP